jgi:hypothetical protein
LILTGDPTLDVDEKIIDDKHLIIKCNDGYESLCQKTIMMIQSIKQLYPDVKGVLKCDDDIIPNIIQLKSLIELVNNDPNIHYLGHKAEYSDNYWSEWHYRKCSNDSYDTPKICKKGVYASGPLYYVSKTSMEMISNGNIYYNTFIFEDNAIGVYLTERGINVYDYKTYSDTPTDCNICCIQNNDNHRFLYIKVEGPGPELENQLPQINDILEIAQKHKRFLVLLYDPSDISQSEMETVFSKFNYTTLHHNCPST